MMDANVVDCSQKKPANAQFMAMADEGGSLTES
jgi:hypothetical protein